MITLKKVLQDNLNLCFHIHFPTWYMSDQNGECSDEYLKVQLYHDGMTFNIYCQSVILNNKNIPRIKRSTK